jgi:thiol reductant ABC exporter CydC subunit
VSRPVIHLLRLLAPFRGPVALAALMGALTTGSSIALLATSAFLISAAALQPSLAELSLAIVGVRFFGIARGLFRYLERLISHSVTFRLLAALRVWFYQAVEPLAPAGLLDYRSGDLLGRAVADVELLQNFYIRVTGPALAALIVTIGATLFLAASSAGLGLLLLLFLAAAGLALPGLSYWLSRGAGRRVVEQRAALQARLVDGVQGMADLQAFGQGDRFLAGTSQAGRELARQQMSLGWLNGLQSGLAVLLANGAAAAVLVAAIPLVRGGEIGGVYLAGLALAALAAFEAVQPLPAAAQSLESCRAAARRLFEIVDRANVGASLAGEDAGAPPAGAPLLVVKDLRFRYEAAGPWTLDGLSFELAAGRKVAIVGPSGAGKSTLVSLLLRFWEYDGGEIWLAGRSIRDYAPDEARAFFAVAPQKGHLFHASIGENLRLARPGASDEEIAAAARRAGIHDFIAGLPQGYATMVGERGMQLSGGERQRLAIARALLRPGPILVLDEPTANLDEASERRIVEEVYHPLHQKGAEGAVLVITHRLVGLEGMDEIVALENGRVVERGRHEALAAAGGCYSRMWQAQRDPD